MRFGVCTGTENLSILEAAGFDLIELNVAGHLHPGDREDDVLPPLRHLLNGSAVRAQTWNGLLPGDLPIVGDMVDTERVDRYLQAAFSRAGALGSAMVVFGSGGARRVPAGFPFARAWEQIAEFLSSAGPLAAAHGITLAIEPLRRAECNILNSVAEAVTMAVQVGHPAVQVLSDLYHVTADGQSYSETCAAGSRLAHVHVATGGDRRAPLSPDVPFLTPFFRALKDAGYAGRVCVEGGWTDIAAEATECCDALHRAWDAA